ncbi:HDOD domain-containing protein [Mariprofundus erugo]|uniref:HDOD domain-containing protein n=1 Tax=Mariprofundus erugo TaxID=2528639 RepID=A0A5R9GJU7_9PROT|nr:HDOD domain-containing protein [Mariprofundus erugo]
MRRCRLGKIHILFVDDHPEVLNGLKRMCRSMRGQWEPSFANGGEQAISMMQADRFDVLVTDMRMPGVGGLEVLRSALSLQPEMVRIVLSGQYDTDDFIRSGWPAHRFLAKPCDADTLKGAINQVLVMRSLLDNQQLKGLIAGAERLPSLPGIYFDIEQELNREHASMQRVGEIISRDVGITAKVLQMANSPIFGCRRWIDNPEQAVVMLGADVIKALTLYIQACSAMPVPEGISLQRIFAHSLIVARLAREIAAEQGQPKSVCSEAFLAGMLQNIGSLVLLSSFPDTYLEIVARAEQQGRPVWELEREILGGNHAEIGGYLISLWGLSMPVVAAVAYHIHPSQCPYVEKPFALTAVHVANAIEKEPGINGAVINNEFDFEYLEQNGLLTSLASWQQLHQKIISANEERLCR